MISFTFLVENEVTKIINQQYYKKWLKNVIFSEKKSLGEVQYIFCTDEYLHNINLSYLNHDTYTDIITFSTSNNKSIISGEIFISIDRVFENSKLLSTSFENELSRVIVHGVLHLLGYDDHSASEKIIMRNKENYYLLLQVN